MERKKRYVFTEIEDTREELEITHLRKKNHLVLGFLVVFLLLTYLYLILTSTPSLDWAYIGVAYAQVLFLNIASLAYGKTDRRFYQLNKTLTTFGIYVVMIVLIFTIDPIILFPALFLAYALSTFYQDIKVMIVADVLLLFTIAMMMLNPPFELSFLSSSLEDNLGLAFFVVVLIALLTIANYIIIKQKRFFYNQIAIAKETQLRNIDLFIDLKLANGETLPNEEVYLERVLAFTDAFCRKIDIENEFRERIELLYRLQKNESIASILTSFPHIEKQELEKLDQLRLARHKQLQRIAVQLSQIQDVEIKHREIFSETQFKSFNHQGDPLEIKMITFAVFYTALKYGNEFTKGLSEDQIAKVLLETDYYYYFDPRIIRLYQKNVAVFEAILADVFSKED